MRNRRTILALGTLLLTGAIADSHQAAYGQDSYSVRISWDPGNDLWPGLILMNTGSRPMNVARVQLNSRDDCVLVPLNLNSVETAPNSSERLRLVALALSSIGSKGVLLDEQDSLQPSERSALTLRVGEQALLVKPPRCGGIVRAQVKAHEATMNVQFNRPYTGNR